MAVADHKKPYFIDDVFGGWDLGDGRPGIGLFGNAVQVWSIMQDGPTTVGAAAEAFNVPVDMVREAVEDHCWMFLTGAADKPADQVIEHDGE